MISEGLMNGTTRFVVLVLPIALASGCVTTGSAPAPTAVAATPSPPATTSDSAPPAAADPARLLDLGRALLARGEMVAATMALREALHLKPDLAEARASLGLALYAMGDLVAAIAWWTRAAEQGVTQAEEGLAQLRQSASGRARRPPADRQAVEQAFGEYRARLWNDYPDIARQGDEPLGAALLRQGRAREAVPVLIREAAALSEPAQRMLATLYDQGIGRPAPPSSASTCRSASRARRGAAAPRATRCSLKPRKPWTSSQSWSPASHPRRRWRRSPRTRRSATPSPIPTLMASCVPCRPGSSPASGRSPPSAWPWWPR